MLAKIFSYLKSIKLKDKTVNKSEFVSVFAEEAAITKTEAARLLDVVLKVIKKSLADKEEIRMVGFGTFKVATVKAKTVRNPQNGQEMRLPESKRPKFVPGKGLKEAVNK